MGADYRGGERGVCYGRLMIGPGIQKILSDFGGGLLAEASQGRRVVNCDAGGESKNRGSKGETGQAPEARRPTKGRNICWMWRRGTGEIECLMDPALRGQKKKQRSPIKSGEKKQNARSQQGK